MCGIAGILNFEREKEVDVSILLKMRDSLLHRGPDGAGVFVEQNIGLAHRRLSIIDLSELGKQPFISNDGRFILVFNGEIFNYIELRDKLISKGYVFKTQTDTEVLLYLLIDRGIDCLEELNGMFAFALWDKRDNQLILVRDRIGIKPLYYSLFNGTLYFASEPKSILMAGVPNDIFEEGLDELLLFRYIAGENTIYKHINRLLPGNYMQIKENSAPLIYRWWNLPDKIRINRENLPQNPFDWFEETFYSAVKYRTISDVPIGIMLSGGLDSGAVAVALSELGNNSISAFTVEFEEEAYNEAELAKKVSLKFGLSFNPLIIKGETLQQNLNEATWLLDEPLVQQNDAQMLALSKFAKDKVSVLLSGEGGDEFMGGYVRYKPLMHYGILQASGWLSKYLKKVPSKSIVNRFDKLERYTHDVSPMNLVLLNASNIYPVDFLHSGYKFDMEKFSYRRSVYEEAKSIFPNALARQAMYLDQFIHMSSVLDRNDRMTMGASIECRVPFMDYRLMEMIPALPSNYLLKGKKGKFLLYNSVAKKLPQEVRDFKKLGFSVPWSVYLKNDPSFMDFISNFSKLNSSDWYPWIDRNNLYKESHKIFLFPHMQIFHLYGR